jgi:hypothetical protein
MEATKFLIFAFVGFCCIVDVQPQVSSATTTAATTTAATTAATTTTQTRPTRPNWRLGFTDIVPTAALDIIEAIGKLRQDFDNMKINGRFDGNLIKRDIQAIVKVADDNGIIIPGRAKTKLNVFLVALDKMTASNKYKPKKLQNGVLHVLNLMIRGPKGFQNFPELLTTTKPTTTTTTTTTTSSG